MSRAGEHLDERMIMGAADRRGLTDGWPAEKRAHLLRCDRCRSLLDQHDGLISALAGDWGERAIAAQAPYRPPMPRRKLLLAGAAAVALAVVATGTWAWLPGQVGSQPTSQPNPSFAVYPVNPDGTSVDSDRCVSPTDTYGRGQVDWGEDFLSGGRFYINFTGQANAHVTAIRALVRSDCAVYVRIVPVSSAVGRALQSQISDAMGSLNAAGVPVWGVVFDPVVDKVVVSVYPMTSEARGVLEGRYPAEMLEIVEAVPPVPVRS
jgi:hypothetical protein